MALPNSVKLVEVSPRDGLQNETAIVPTNIKVKFINQLSETGLTTIEVGSFVSAKWLPQMADTEQVLQTINQKPHINYPVLVPNRKGFEAALKARVREIAVFAAASETFSQRNINCSIQESLVRYAEIITEAKKHHIMVRGYVSCVLGCPYEGEIKSEAVLNVAEKLFTLGCYEISLGDTIGVGTPHNAQTLIDTVAQKIPREKLAAHFHDTYGQALVNIYAVLAKGITIIDSSVAGLGGCPYAKGASGNVATEDVLYMLNGLNIYTGVDLDKLIAAGNFISTFLKRKTQSKVALAKSY